MTIAEPGLSRESQATIAQPVGGAYGRYPSEQATIIQPHNRGSSEVVGGFIDNSAETNQRGNGSDRPQPATAPPVPDARELPSVGTRINQYELIRELGRGGMGAVFLARDTKLARRVAIKFLQSGQEELNARFMLEARATAQFQHENIVVIYEIGEHQKNPYMVLEYLQGAPLTKQLKKGRKMSATRAIEIMVPVVKALVAAHEHGIVHRDLKPDNIFITETGAVKVLDFGIAKLVDDQPGSSLLADSGIGEIPEVENTGSSQLSEITGGSGGTGDVGTGGSELTRRGAIMGTLPYMSPEQWGIDTVDHRTDLWAVGILLFRMVTGKHPLHPLSGQQLVITAVLDQPMPRARSVAPEIPQALGNLIDRCLIKPKNQRIGTAKELLAELERMMPRQYTRKWNPETSPYAGLKAFQEADADRFFGRNREISAVASRLRDQPLMGIAGPSGVGKSSFVRAGVVPALKASGENWETVVIRPGRQPIAALANALAPLVGSGSENTGSTGPSMANDISEYQHLLQRLHREPGFLGSVMRAHARRTGTKLLLFVDQFEELYTMSPEPAERMAFTACLTGVADDATTPLRVVISIRSDFLDRVAEDPVFMGELTQGLFFLTPPNRQGLSEALTQPAEMAGFQFETMQTVEHMLDHLENTPGALPLLQFAATKLWEARDRGRKLLTNASYQAIGGIVGALASHADSVLQELTPQQQRLVRAVFLRLVTPERTRAIVSVDELCELSRDPNEVRRLVDHLVSARLLTVQTGDLSSAGSASVEIVHESLIHSWPMLRRWLDENQDDAAFLEQLRNAARQWQAKGYPNGLLWRGEAMEEAKRWYRRYRGELPELQKQYLNAVFALHMRTERRKKLLVASVIAILSLMVAAAAVALVLIRDAQKKATADRDRAEIAQRDALAAKAQAEENLREVQEKERLRQEEERLKKVAQDEAEEANREVARKNEELEAKADELQSALYRAQKAKRRARKAAARAARNEAEALEAKAEAEDSKKEVEVLLTKEQERVKRLQQQLGSPMIDRLK